MAHEYGPVNWALCKARNEDFLAYSVQIFECLVNVPLTGKAVFPIFGKNSHPALIGYCQVG